MRTQQGVGQPLTAVNVFIRCLLRINILCTDRIRMCFLSPAHFGHPQITPGESAIESTGIHDVGILGIHGYNGTLTTWCIIPCHETFRLLSECIFNASHKTSLILHRTYHIVGCFHVVRNVIKLGSRYFPEKVLPFCTSII